MPVMVWDLLPEDQACSFVAFIRSNNLIKPGEIELPPPAPTVTLQGIREDGAESTDEDDGASVFSGTTMTPTVGGRRVSSATHRQSVASVATQGQTYESTYNTSRTPGAVLSGIRRIQTEPQSQALKPTISNSSTGSGLSFNRMLRQRSNASTHHAGDNIAKNVIMNQHRSAKRPIVPGDASPPRHRALSRHIQLRLEEYFLTEPNPSVGITEFFASNLGAEVKDIDVSLS